MHFIRLTGATILCFLSAQERLSQAVSLTSPNLLAEFHSMFSARLTGDFDSSTGETPSSGISPIPAKTQATGSAT